VAAAAEDGSIVPIRVGTQDVIRAFAEAGGVDLGAFDSAPAAGLRAEVAEAIRLAPASPRSCSCPTRRRAA